GDRGERHRGATSARPGSAVGLYALQARCSRASWVWEMPAVRLPGYWHSVYLLRLCKPDDRGGRAGAMHDLRRAPERERQVRQPSVQRLIAGARMGVHLRNLDAYWAAQEGHQRVQVRRREELGVDL